MFILNLNSEYSISSCFLTNANIKHKLSVFFLSLSKDEVTTKILCEPCSTEDLQIQATHLCKTCENPEPLCETCAKNHTKQKLCRDHQISGDVRELQKIKQ